MEKGFKCWRQGAVGTPALMCSANHQREPEAKLTSFFREDPGGEWERNAEEALGRNDSQLYKGFGL